MMRSVGTLHALRARSWAMRPIALVARCHAVMAVLVVNVSDGCRA